MTLRELGRMIRRRRRIIIAVTAVVVGITAAITFLMRPRYESEAVLRIKDEDPSNSLLSKLGPIADLGLPGLGQSDVDTEIGVLRSRRIAQAVADSLALHVEMLAPTVPRDSVLAILQAPENATPATYRLRRSSDGSYSVQVEESKTRVKIPSRVEIGRPASLGGVSLLLLPSLRAHPPEEIRLRVRPFLRALHDMRETLDVDRQESGSKLVEVAYRSTDPVLAAEVVNSVARHFMEYNRQVSTTESRSTVSVLREQISDYRQQLREAEDRLQRYQEREKVVSPTAEAEQQVKRLAELQTKRDALQVERNALADLLRQVDQGQTGPNGETPYRRLATFPSFISNRAVQDLLQDLIRLEDERAELMVRRTPQNADVRGIDERITALEEQLHRMATNYVASLDTELTATQTALEEFSRELELLPARAVEYARRLREEQLLTEVYLQLQTKLKAAELKEAVDQGDVRIVDTGIVPDEPVLPKPAVNLVLATVLGLMLGLAGALGREMVDTSVRTRTEAEDLTGGVPVIGAIPPIGSSTGVRRKTPGRRKLWIPRLQPGLPVQERPIALADPFAPAADAYRALHANLSMVSPAGDRGIILVTSAQPDAGKSTVATNLAVTLAHHDRATLLVDADLRGGELNQRFGVPRAPGLSELLRGEAETDEAICGVDTGGSGGGLFFLSAGAQPLFTSELLDRERLQELFAALRSRFGSIVIDTPPLDRAADAALLGALADTSIVVVRSGITDREALRQAIGRLRRASAHVGGIVLNDIPSPRGAKSRYPDAQSVSHRGNGAGASV